MGDFLTPGHTYVDGSTVTGANLTEHVAEATFKASAISGRTLRTPATLTDQILVAASDVLYQQTLQQIHDLILYPGSVVQTVYTEYTANTNLTTTIPYDDTIPQNTEGTEIISRSITPRFATSTILAKFNGQLSLSIVGWGIAALFRDSEASAVASQVVWAATANTGELWSMSYMDSPATASAVTYKIRVGPDSGTLRLNGVTSGRLMGGSSRATLILQEIKA